jgi:excisionase family DNA binding protein
LPTTEKSVSHEGRAERLAGNRLAYPIDEFADAVGIGRSKLYAEIRAGKLKAKKLGSRTLITATEAHAYIDSLPDMP